VIDKIKNKLRSMEEDWCYPECRDADVPKLARALSEAVDFIQWLRAKGIVLSGGSSLSEECLEKILKQLNS
jgi:hypothetical protein